MSMEGRIFVYNMKKGFYQARGGGQKSISEAAHLLDT